MHRRYAAISLLMAMGLVSGQAQTRTVAAAMASQAVTPPPVFTAASIKPNNQLDKAGILRPTPGTLTAENMAVTSYIRWAWDVKPYQISVPPALQAVADSRYDIIGKAEGAAPVDQLRLMLRSLLMERFHLAVHSEKRDVPVFALVVAKGGPKQLHIAAPDNVPHMTPDSSRRDGGQHWLFYSLPVSAVIGIMSNGLNRPFIDQTGIKESFDFGFVLPVWDRAEGSLEDHLLSNVFPELERQLGLRVQAQTAPLDLLVIDHIDKTPTEN